MPTVHLPKKFGFLNAISINMSNMVGTGPFITVPAILATRGGPQALICWFLGAVIAIADGLVFAELGTTFPSSGGSYNYLRECFGREGLGRLMAWLFVWQFLFSGTLEIARIMLVLWGGLLLTSLWVVVEGALHFQTRLLFDFPAGAFHLNLAF